MIKVGLSRRSQTRSRGICFSRVGGIGIRRRLKISRPLVMRVRAPHPAPHQKGKQMKNAKTKSNKTSINILDKEIDDLFKEISNATQNMEEILKQAEALREELER